jgi:hypothetical protein
VVGTLSTKPVVRYAAELVVNQRHQAAQRLLVTGPPLGQELADGLGDGSWHSIPAAYQSFLERKDIGFGGPSQFIKKSTTCRICGGFLWEMVSQLCSELHFNS